MLIKKYRYCEVCGKQVGVNRAYTQIKFKNYVQGFGSGCKDNRKIDICYDCFFRNLKFDIEVNK